MPSRACPCTQTTPCHPRCTCVQGHSSRGCKRCCTYGSEEQRRQKAEWLAAKIDVPELPPVPDAFRAGDEGAVDLRAAAERILQFAFNESGRYSGRSLSGLKDACALARDYLAKNPA
jgi:hypothetical protein